VRLDHLLSKEQLADGLRTGCPWFCFEDVRSSADQLTSGTSTIWSARKQELVSTVVRLVRPAWNLEQERASIPGTLLGPEGSSDRFSPGHSSRELPNGRTRPPGQRGSEEWRRPYLENYTVDASIFVARQATKGTWWMPWHQEPMKDVGACDKPRGVGNRAVIRGFPNGETQLESCPVTSV
jgi:hypothetical protein